MGTVTSPNYTNTHTMADAAPAKKVVKAKKVAKPAAHPPFKAMILTAIKALKEREGSSRQAILKYVVANNKVDAAKAAGKGAGKFKAGKVEKPKKAKKAKKPKAKEPKKVKKAKKPKAKKPAKKAAKKPAKKVAKKAAKKAAKKPAKKAAKKAAPKKK